jgi:hypothetical protein
MDRALEDADKIEADFADAERKVDEMRENLYRPFRPHITSLVPILLISV